jgi:hypothetical protein
MTECVSDEAATLATAEFVCTPGDRVKFPSACSSDLTPLSTVLLSFLCAGTKVRPVTGMQCKGGEGSGSEDYS